MSLEMIVGERRASSGTERDMRAGHLSELIVKAFRYESPVYKFG